MQQEHTQRRVTLYISMSLDGYIADKAGGVGWLGGEDPAYPGDYGYGDFFAGMDTVVMGGRTYRQIVEELSPGQWPYPGRACWVVTRSPQPLPSSPSDADGVRFTAEAPERLIARLKAAPGGGIWLCGGAQLVGALAAADAIDEYRITILPVLLGGGVRLFAGDWGSIPLHLVRTRCENGAVECVYTRREEAAL